MHKPEFEKVLMVGAVLLARFVPAAFQKELGGLRVKWEIRLRRKRRGACRADRPKDVKLVGIKKAHSLNRLWWFVLRAVAVAADAVLHRRDAFRLPAHFRQYASGKLRAEQVMLLALLALTAWVGAAGIVQQRGCPQDPEVSAFFSSKPFSHPINS